MYLFTRTNTINGAKIRDALAFCTDITNLVKERTDLPVALYMNQFGLPVGSVIWSTAVESHAQLNEAFNTLFGDEEYLQRVEQAFADDLFLTPSTDTLARVVDVQGMVRPQNVVTVVSAQCQIGNLAKALEWGAEMSHYAAGVTGTTAMFLADSYGDFGRVTWLAGADDMAAIDDADDKLVVDPGYIQRIDDAGTQNLFIPTSGQRGLITRLA